SQLGCYWSRSVGIAAAPHGAGPPVLQCIAFLFLTLELMICARVPRFVCVALRAVVVWDLAGVRILGAALAGRVGRAALLRGAAPRGPVMRLLRPVMRLRVMTCRFRRVCRLWAAGLRNR